MNIPAIVPYDLSMNDEAAYQEHLERLIFEPDYAEGMRVRRAYVASLSLAGWCNRNTETGRRWGEWPQRSNGRGPDLAVIAGFHAPPFYGRRDVQAMFGRDL